MNFDVVTQKDHLSKLLSPFVSLCVTLRSLPVKVEVHNVKDGQPSAKSIRGIISLASSRFYELLEPLFRSQHYTKRFWGATCRQILPNYRRPYLTTFPLGNRHLEHGPTLRTLKVEDHYHQYPYTLCYLLWHVFCCCVSMSGWVCSDAGEQMTVSESRKSLRVELRDRTDKFQIWLCFPRYCRPLASKGAAVN